MPIGFCPWFTVKTGRDRTDEDVAAMQMPEIVEIAKLTAFTRPVFALNGRYRGLYQFHSP